MIVEAANDLIATCRDATSSQQDVDAAAQSFFNAASTASSDDVQTALHKLGNQLDLANLPRACFLALVCGTLVEDGADPSTIAEPLIERLRSLLHASAELADACRARMPATSEESEDSPDSFEKIRHDIAEEMPQQSEAWDALQEFARAGVAAFSSCFETRAEARPLLYLIGKIADCHAGAHWLQQLLPVLHNDPILVIEPQKRTGILARMSGVVDNFQLNVLLMDAFPRSGMFARRRVPKSVADVARGIGPQQTADTITGVWNMYMWPAIEPGHNLPKPNDMAACPLWIWNEATPQDIPLFEERRVILLGPASYSRSWQSQRMFNKLPASIEIERNLSIDEMNSWLDRMVAAKNAS